MLNINYSGTFLIVYKHPVRCSITMQNLYPAPARHDCFTLFRLFTQFVFLLFQNKYNYSRAEMHYFTMVLNK